MTHTTQPPSGGTRAILQDLHTFHLAGGLHDMEVRRLELADGLQETPHQWSYHEVSQLDSWGAEPAALWLLN